MIKERTVDESSALLSNQDAALSSPDGCGNKKTSCSVEEEGRISNVFQLLGVTCFCFASAIFLHGTRVLIPLFIGRNVKNPAPFLGTVDMVAYSLQLLGLVISYFSDRCTARFGRRRPFIAVSGVMMIIACTMILLGIKYCLVWVTVCGNWLMTFAMSIANQANSALVSDITAKRRIGIAGGMTSLWTAVGGACGLVMVLTVSNLIIVCSVFCGCALVSLIIVMLCAKERQLSEDNEILIPLRGAKTLFQRLWIMAKDFVGSFLFSAKLFPDFFLLLLFHAVYTISAAPAAFGQYFLNDIMKAPNPLDISCYMTLIVLGLILITSPIFGAINDCLKRPRLVMIFGCVLRIASISVFFWAPNLYYFYFMESPLFGVFTSAVSSSEVAVTIAIMPLRDKAAQFFAELSLFELVSKMISSASIGLIMGMYSMDDQSSSDVSSSSSSDQIGPQLYSRKGYNIMYSIGIGAVVASLIVLLFINTGRGRRAQERMKEKVEKERQRILAEEEEKEVPTLAGSINGDDAVETNN